MPTAINIIGRTFGKLTVVSDAPPRFRKNGKPTRMSNCLCACGKEIAVKNMKLLNGHTASCGCQRAETLRVKLTTHGHARRESGGGKTKTYLCWRNMISRCNNPKNKRYKHYGGRGIKVAQRWLDSFENFLADVGEAPEGLTLDRVENDLGYEPGNVKWSTVLEQNQHRSRDYNFTVHGVTGSLSMLCRHFKIPHYNCVLRRVRDLGWLPEEAIFTPPGEPKPTN